MVAAVNRLRELDLAKPPGVAETIDWVRTLDVLGAERSSSPRSPPTRSARCVKDRDDLELVREDLDGITAGA